MKKKLFVILFISLFLFATGCNQTTNTDNKGQSHIQLATDPPEPYEMAIKEIEELNFKKAIRYCDLVISDFPQSEEFVYKANLLKSMIYINYQGCAFDVANMILDGMRNSLSFGKQEGYDTANTFLDSLTDSIEGMEKPFMESTSYVLDNYDKYKDTSFVFQKAQENYDTDSLHDIKWFADHGTPIPTNDEFIKSTLTYYEIGFYNCYDYFFKEGQVNYPSYFFYASMMAVEWNKDLSKSLLQKVMEITEDDKYNSYRLDAEDALSNVPN